MPGAAQDPAAPADVVLPGSCRRDEPRDRAAAEGAALVGTAISQRKELPIDVEDADRPPLHLDDLPCSRRDLVHRRHDVLRHGSSANRWLASHSRYNARAFPAMILACRSGG